MQRKKLTIYSHRTNFQTKACRRYPGLAPDPAALLPYWPFHPPFPYPSTTSGRSPPCPHAQEQDRRCCKKLEQLLFERDHRLLEKDAALRELRSALRVFGQMRGSG